MFKVSPSASKSHHCPTRRIGNGETGRDIQESNVCWSCFASVSRDQSADFSSVRARGGHRQQKLLLRLLDLFDTGVDLRDPLAGAFTLHISPGPLHLKASNLHVTSVGQGELIHPAGQGAELIQTFPRDS